MDLIRQDLALALQPILGRRGFALSPVSPPEKGLCQFDLDLLSDFREGIATLIFLVFHGESGAKPVNSKRFKSI